MKPGKRALDDESLAIDQPVADHELDESHGVAEVRTFVGWPSGCVSTALVREEGGLAAG